MKIEQILYSSTILKLYHNHRDTIPLGLFVGALGNFG